MFAIQVLPQIYGEDRWNGLAVRAMCRKSKFRNVAILVFLYIFCTWSAVSRKDWYSLYRPSLKLWWRSVKRFGSLSHFWKFKISDVGHRNFSYIICGLVKKLMFIKSVLPQSLIKIGESVWKSVEVFEIQRHFGGEEPPNGKLKMYSLTRSFLRECASFKLARV